MAKVYFKYSTMGAGKTALACITAYNYEEQGLTPLCLSPLIDTRSGSPKTDKYGIKKGKWQSRIEGLSREVFLVSPKNTIIRFFTKISWLYMIKPDVIIIDEVQFFKEEQIEELFKIAIYWNIPVICYGLLTDFKTHLFEGSKRLIELGAKLEHIKSISENGERTVINAKFQNGKLITKGETIDIGGNEKYKAMSLKEFWDLLEKQRLLEGEDV